MKTNVQDQKNSEIERKNVSPCRKRKEKYIDKKDRDREMHVRRVTRVIF